MDVVRKQGADKFWTKQGVRHLVDRLNMPKFLSPVSSTNRVKKVNRQDRNMEERRFARQLREEEEKTGEKKDETESGSDNGDDRVDVPDSLMTNGSGNPPETGEQKEIGEKNRGNVIDIRV